MKIKEYTKKQAIEQLEKYECHFVTLDCFMENFNDGTFKGELIKTDRGFRIMIEND